MKKCIAIFGIICILVTSGWATMEVKKIGAISSTSTSTPCDLPPPVNLQSVLLDEHTIILSWDAPLNVITSGYLVSTFDEFGNNIDNSITSDTHIAIDGLTENKAYSSQVHSICADGSISDEYATVFFSMTIIIDLILNVICEEPSTPLVAGNHLYAVPVTQTGASADWLPFPPNSNRMVYHAKVFRQNFEEIHHARFLMVRDLNSDTIHLKIYNPTGKMKVVLTPTKLNILFNNQFLGDLRFTPSGYAFNKASNTTVSYGAKVDYFSNCLVSSGNNSGGQNLTATGDDEWGQLAPESSVVENKMLDVQVSPNPFTDQLNILFLSETDQRVEASMYDTAGKHIKELTNAWYLKGLYQLEINTADLPAGIYYIVTTTDKGIKMLKVVK